jgi:hypothetical protein
LKGEREAGFPGDFASLCMRIAEVTQIQREEMDMKRAIVCIMVLGICVMGRVSQGAEPGGGAGAVPLVQADDVIAKYPRIDVRAFGAVPDDGKDDTDAIAQAVAYADKATKAIRPSSYVGCGPAVYFPAGIYHISKEISVGAYTSLAGDSGKSILQWLDDESVPAKETESMFRISCYTNRIENIKFIGGTTHLLFHNRNTNQTVLDIEGCEFQLSKGFAVRAIPSGGANHLSTLMIIQNCKFLKNYQCLETYCDVTNVIHTWVETGQPFAADAAVFLNKSGCLFFEDMCGVPGHAKGKEPMKKARWVDNYGVFQADRTRFGGEGAGIPIVYNYAKFNVSYPYMGGGKIIITNSVLCAGSGREEACVMRLFEVPSEVILRDNFLLSNAPLMLVDEALNLDEWFAKVPEKRRTFKYVIEPNITWPPSMIATVPEQLRPFINPLREMYYDMPKTGYWRRGHVLLNRNAENGSHVGIVNTADGEPGTWGYFGKVSPFPVGAEEGELLSGNLGKYTIDIPENVGNFGALVTVGCNPDASGSDGFAFCSFEIFLQTVHDGKDAKDHITSRARTMPEVAGTHTPRLRSVHFGMRDRGGNIRMHTKGGKVTMILENCASRPLVSIEPFMVR